MHVCLYVCLRVCLHVCLHVCRFYLFIARVCVGVPYKTNRKDRGLKRPPEMRGSSHLYDSVLFDQSAKHREVVVYDRTACYPEFLIEYSRENSGGQA